MPRDGELIPATLRAFEPPKKFYRYVERNGGVSAGRLNELAREGWRVVCQTRARYGGGDRFLLERDRTPADDAPRPAANAAAPVGNGVQAGAVTPQAEQPAPTPPQTTEALTGNAEGTQAPAERAPEVG
jgi:hypothetical protein